MAGKGMKKSGLVSTPSNVGSLGSKASPKMNAKVKGSKKAY